MKKSVFCVLLAVSAAAGSFAADRIDNIVATVELIRREPITRASVDARYDEILKASNNALSVTKKEVLDNNILEKTLRSMEA